MPLRFGDVVVIDHDNRPFFHLLYFMGFVYRDFDTVITLSNEVYLPATSHRLL